MYVACSNDDKDLEEELPSVLLTTKGEKLIRREKARIITHKTPQIGSEDFMFLNVLFYHPHSSEKEVNVNKEDLKELFNRKDFNPEKDGSGKILTKIETIRAKLHPRLNPDLWSLFDHFD